MAVAVSSKVRLAGPTVSISLWAYRIFILSLLLYIAAMECTGGTLLRQLHVASTDEEAALRLAAAKGWISPNSTAAKPPACPACECHCDAAACPQCPEAPGPEAVAAAKAGPHPPPTTFCPWSAYHSVFHRQELAVDFRRGETICADAIMFGYDLMFETWGMWRQMFWLGVPTEQDPTDMHVLQEVLWDVRPDVVIELGTNTGGGALTFASIMHLMEHATNGTKDYKRMRVITIDPRDFHDPQFPGDSCTPEKPCPRPDANPLWSEHVTFIQGIPTDPQIVERVQGLLNQWNATTVMVSEDSGHVYEMVLDNIRAYKQFVSVGSYLLVQDTKLTRMWKRDECNPDDKSLEEFNKCWNERRVGPLDSVIDFLKEEPAGVWEQDKSREHLGYTQHADGWLKRLR